MAKIRNLGIPMCALLLAECGGARFTRIEALDVAYEARVPAPDTTGNPLGPLREVEDALELPALDAVVLPDHVREIRFVDWYPMVAGYSEPFLRLVESPGGVRGMLGEWWMVTPYVSWEERPGVSCTDASGRQRFCVEVLPLPEGVAWEDVADQLSRLGAWVLREPCESDNPLTAIMDAGELMIERLDHDDFEVYRCNAPTHRTGVTGMQAARLYDYFTNLVRSAAQRRQR